MHHLEPLSWDRTVSRIAFSDENEQIVIGLQSAPTSDNAAWGYRERARRRLAIHSTFRLIAAFQQGIEQAAPPTMLAATANAVLELARLEFALDSWQPRRGAHPLCKGDRCIAELECLVATLSSGSLLPPLELVHAMDSLIGLLVQVDADYRISTHTAS